VPYGPVDRPEGGRNHGYMRIKDDPAMVERIPEAAGYPELASLLAAVNGPDSPIESVGCEKSVLPVDKGDARVQLGSYIDVIFTNASLNDSAEHALQLAVHLLQAVQGCDCWWTSVEALLQRFRFVPQTVAPWGLMLRVNTCGRDEAEARKFWGVTLERLGNAVQALPRDFRWRGHSQICQDDISKSSG
jgi:hypothetical protein